MPKFTFDGPNALIVASAGVTASDVQVDLYSDWKEWASLSDNLKFREAFTTAGGNPATDVKNVGDYYFLQNQAGYGWRIRLDEADHEHVFDGNLYKADVTLPIFVPTLGAFTVLATIERSADALSLGSEFGVAQRNKLDELHERNVQAVGSTLHTTPSTLRAGSITYDITGDPEASVLMTRTA